MIFFWITYREIKCAPLPSSDSAQIFPPCRSVILLQIAKPMPVPGYLSLLCKRLKGRKI